MRAGLVLVSIWATIFLGACSPERVGTTMAAAAASAPNQSEVCQAVDWQAHPTCRPGQKIAFLPKRFGNEQLPVMFAAVNCDLRHAVVITNGAVTCIFMPAAKIEEIPRPADPASIASAPKS